MTEKGAIRQVFQHVMRGAGRMGWMIGHIDAATASLDVVLADAKANLARNPRHAFTNEAVNILTTCIHSLGTLSDKMETVAAGEDEPGARKDG